MERLNKGAVIGAGFYGMTTAMRIAEYEIFNNLVLTDIKDEWAEGLALDMNSARPLTGSKTNIIGKTTTPDGGGYEVLEGAEVIVVTAGLPRKPGMSRMDLIEVNSKIVGGIGENIARHAPDAVVIVVSNPLDEMTQLTQTATGFPAQRVMGQAGMLDSARFAYFISEKLGVDVDDVQALTLGSHGDTMVPIPSQCSVTIDGTKKPLADVMDQATIDKLVQRTRDGGAEVVALLKTGSAFFAPSAAAARMAKAVATDSGEIMPVTAQMNGEYGIDNVYLGVEAKIGRAGVVEIIERDLTESELSGLQAASVAVKEKCEALSL